MNMQLRQYQQIAVEHALNWFAGAQPGARRLYAAPTGVGKSYIQLALLATLPHAWLITPRQEIIDGLVAKGGPPDRLWTPIKLRNRMLAGTFEGDVRQLIFDEGHHAEASSWQSLELLAGKCPAVAYTATPFRGTPRSTAAFRAAWGEPTWIITYPEAFAAGYISLPTARVVPLLDDDVLTVSQGDFAISAVERETQSRLTDAAQLVSSLWNTARRPTMVSAPTTEIARQLHGALPLPSRLVTAETTPADRLDAFARCVAAEAVLVQINVVSEGVDLPIRRLIDLSPTLSPVRWLQQLGRITRPVAAGEPAPEYLCTNRNLLRHAYLLEGCLPATVILQAQQAFPPSKRSAVRVLGLEALGRLKPAALPLGGGLTGQVYAFSALEGPQVREYAVLLHPAREEAIWATRTNISRDDGTKGYGRWAACEPPAELSGFASLPASPPSEKQLAWWERSAARHGLDPSEKPTRKSFAALPVLSDLRRRI